MFKKILLGILVVTVFGTAGAALAYNLVNKDEAFNVEASETTINDDLGSDQEPLQLAEGSLGEPWKETGTIVELDDTGFKFQLQNGEIVYVELGPPEYWQNQGIELMAGMPVIVDGTINEGMIHAHQVMLVDGQVLQVRNEDGQPLWSGGIDNGQGANGNNEDGHSADLNQIDEWVTIEGTLISFQGGNMAMSTIDGEIISFQSGQPRFFASQDVSFQVGDEIIVVGYYVEEQLMAGDITQVETGLRVMLRDPNGRPLWAGPGGNGNGNGGGKQG